MNNPKMGVHETHFLNFGTQPSINFKRMKLDTSFLRASSMLKHVIAIGSTTVRPFVCLSVRLSVRHTLVLYQNGSTYRQTLSTAW